MQLRDPRNVPHTIYEERLPTKRQPVKQTKTQDQQIPPQPQLSSDMVGYAGSISQNMENRRKKINKKRITKK